MPNLVNVGQTLKRDGANFVVAYGYCWGGKVVVEGGLLPETPFEAIAEVHPAYACHQLSLVDADSSA